MAKEPSDKEKKAIEGLKHLSPAQIVALQKKWKGHLPKQVKTVAKLLDLVAIDYEESVDKVGILDQIWPLIRVSEKRLVLVIGERTSKLMQVKILSNGKLSVSQVPVLSKMYLKVDHILRGYGVDVSKLGY